MTKILIAFAFALALAACGNKPVSPDTPYVIEGELTGVKDSVQIRLYLSDTGGSTLLETDTIINGRFRFQQVMQDIEQKKLFLSAIGEDFPPMLLNIYVAPGAIIKVTGHDTHIATWDVKSAVPEQIERNKLYEVVKEEYDQEQAALIEIGKKRSELRSIDRDVQPDLYNKVRDEYNALLEVVNNIPSIIERKKIERMKTMKPSALWLKELYYIALSAGSKEDYPYREEAIAMYQSIPEDMKQSTEGKEIYANLFPPQPTKEGELSPDADFYDLDGNLHHLSELRGKYVLIDFWSGGCGPCLLAFKEMKEMQEQYGDQLAIVSLSIDSDARWRKTSKEHAITWNNWNEGKGMGGLSVNYRVSAIPHYVLLSPEGIIEKQLIGYEEGMFKNLFSELF